MISLDVMMCLEGALLSLIHEPKVECLCRQIEEEEFERRINELEELEALEENTCQRPNPRSRRPHRPEALPAYRPSPAMSQHSRYATYVIS